MADAIFQLTVVSQNDPQSQPEGSHLSVVVDPPVGGKLRSNSSPIDTPIPLPIPPAPGTKAPPSPTWFLELDDTIENASYTLTVSGPDGADPTHITVKGSDMPGWVAQNRKQKTNQIYKKGKCGIFGFAQEHTPAGQPTYWIYTVTGGVSHPQVDPPA
jgi:hypothetical protein